MALDPSTATSYSPENGLPSRRPQFNGSPETLYYNGAVPSGTGYLNAGAWSQVTAGAAAPVQPEPTPKDGQAAADS